MDSGDEEADLEGVDGMLSGFLGESEREKVQLNCEHPRHVIVASGGIPGPSPPTKQNCGLICETNGGWQEVTTFDGHYSITGCSIACATVI